LKGKPSCAGINMGTAIITVIAWSFPKSREL